MFGEIGFEKLLLIVFIVVLLFGARKIPELAGSMGKGIREFKRNLADPDRAARGTSALRDAPETDRMTPPTTRQDFSTPAVRDDPSRQDPKRLLG